MHHSLIAEFLEGDEIYRLIRTCKKLFSYFLTDKYFNRVIVDNFDIYFTQQFAKAYDNKPSEKESNDLKMTAVDLTSISIKKFTANDTKICVNSSRTWPVLSENDKFLALKQMSKARIGHYS